MRNALRKQQLHPSLQRVLRWTSAMAVISFADLERIAWRAVTTSRQNRSALRQRWLANGYLATQDERWYALGPAGARALREQSIDARPPRKPYSVGLPGLLTTSRFAIGMTLDLADDPWIADVSWKSRAFVGRGARADADGVMILTAPQPERRTATRAEAFFDPLAEIPLSAGAVRWRIFLEFDKGTESIRALEHRMDNWMQRLADERVNAPDLSPPIFLWVLDHFAVLVPNKAMPSRLATIYDRWVVDPPGVAWFTTTGTLQGKDRWTPWTALWVGENYCLQPLNHHLLPGASQPTEVVYE